jgi:hypothetical protein
MLAHNLEIVSYKFRIARRALAPICERYPITLSKATCNKEFPELGPRTKVRRREFRRRGLYKTYIIERRMPAPQPVPAVNGSVYS